ncbi:MAG: hypothetical protein IT363_05780 [Methanoregulaceae archaeon]|jgi:hypothetical protein|nr:hypothetical protein [Methanoregulaceae archaeon]
MCIFKLIISHSEDAVEEYVVSAPECPIVRDLLQWTESDDTHEAMVSESDCGTVRPPQVMFVTPSDEEPTYIVRATR